MENEANATSTPLPESLAIPELLELQKTLLDVGWLTTEQWNQAVSKFGPNADLETFLLYLTTVEAPTISPEEHTTVLTKYQAQTFLEGNARKLWFQHYLILDQLGAEGTGEVFKVLNCDTLRLEKLKIMKPQAEAGPLDTSVRDRFKREAEILARLDHPYITKAWNVGFEDERAYIATEYVPGKDLETIVREHQRENRLIPIHWAIEKIIMVAEAFEQAHMRGIVHRDIKPSNIMITEDEIGLKVHGWGIARMAVNAPVDSESPPGPHPPTGPLGTPAFMPPETVV